mmetsp:Transcript_33936/g.44772  ORF Transcript_33936/g.44772 Transcript_33936/m.44772 type:complete len:244 (-) Transcript_33936:547-1278(-)|eukprot:CAMPEP_0117754178 /NCGR_PEP_ID=MMETSP0947-20121206/12678_1 /TAXON_ID=44440 /ORGANISM="Chattonella subsalsa, Strain CCMP2191" /LENGTH=243 /DNA_ID=CAMNT_0005573225 /DNA_START=160 /DNA_END=891 /DNA_ORIENTATION=+
MGFTNILFTVLGLVTFLNLQPHSTSFPMLPSSYLDNNNVPNFYDKSRATKITLEQVQYSRSTKTRFIVELSASEDEDGTPLMRRKRVRKKRKETFPLDDQENIEISVSYEDGPPQEESLLNQDKEEALAVSGGSSKVNDEQLLADIAAFKKAAPVKEEVEEGAMDRAKDIFSTVLVFDFFVVLGLLGWFLIGVVAKYAFGNTEVIGSFRSSFDLVVQPAIGVLMMGTLAGAAMSKLNEEDESQ